MPPIGWYSSVIPNKTFGPATSWAIEQHRFVYYGVCQSSTPAYHPMREYLAYQVERPMAECACKPSRVHCTKRTRQCIRAGSRLNPIVHSERPHDMTEKQWAFTLFRVNVARAMCSIAPQVTSTQILRPTGQSVNLISREKQGSIE